VTPADVKRLRELLSTATPGPWHAEDWYLSTGDDELAEFGVKNSPEAALIVAAVNALPDLLTALEAAEGRVAELEKDQPCYDCGEIPAGGFGTRPWCGRHQCT
jgi:hypothetical protein